MPTTTMSIVCRLAGEDESEHPKTCCLVLAAAVRQFDGHLTQAQRQELAQALVGSRTPELEVHRAWALVRGVARLSKTYPPSQRKKDRAEAAEVRWLLREVNQRLTEDYYYLSADRMGRVVAACPGMVPEVLRLVASLAREQPRRGQDG
jgi:DNA-directed RNA polymerase sigma subunit (sigma70/sigma32)